MQFIMYDVFQQFGLFVTTIFGLNFEEVCETLLVNIIFDIHFGWMCLVFV
jgi:hypothetical protein